MRCLYIFNPVSGKGKLKKKEDYIVNKLKEKFEEVNVCETEYSGHAYQIITTIGIGYDYIVVGGGDGTLDEVVNGIKSNKLNVVLGYIPTGTVNDFSRNFKISKNIKKAVKTIVEGRVVCCDCLKINGRYGVYVCGCGIFTCASYEAKQKIKNKIGKLAYYLKGAKDFFKYKPFNVIVKNEEIDIREKASMVLVINSKWVSGFNLNKKGDMHNGLVDVVVVSSGSDKKIKLGSKLAIFKMFLFGIPKKSKYIKTFETDKLTVKFKNKMNVNIDGEMEQLGKVDVEVVKDGLNILVNNYEC